MTGVRPSVTARRRLALTSHPINLTRTLTQGITLTAAHHVVFAELSWTPSDMEQCIDRVHRLGQKAAAVKIVGVGSGWHIRLWLTD